MGFDPYIGAKYRVEVQETFKGAPAKQITLFSENSTARFWLTPGDSYLIFIDQGVFDKPVNRAWTIDTCGNSGAYEPNSKALKEVRALAAANH